MNNLTSNKISTVLIVATFVTFGFINGVSAQETKPNKRVIITDTTKTVVKATPILKTKTVVKATSIPKTETETKTLSYLQSRIDLILANPMLRRGRVGVKIISLQSGKTVYEKNAENYFMPASNMKSFTVASAIDKLGSNFRFKTSVYAEKPPQNGTIAGDLIIYGRGDPSISTAFNDGDYYKALDRLADKIVKAGVKRVTGNIIGDETYFNTRPIPIGWEWDDLQWYYGAEISSLSLNDNAVDLKILPSSVGTPLVVQILPQNQQFKIINKSQTTAPGTKKDLRVHKVLGQNIVEITGTMPENSKGFNGSITINRPANLFVELLKQRLQLKGVIVHGTTKAVNIKERNGIRLPVENYNEIAYIKSPMLSNIAAKTMKPSQNLYTELILRSLGEETSNQSDTDKSSEQKGIDIVQETLAKAGVMTDSLVQYDASGLSRHNLITPNSSAMLYKYMDKSRNSSVWKSVLTIGGVDGTLKRRFRGTNAENNVRGKTGTLDQVSALSGYVNSKSGERFAFSILTNNIPGSRLRTSTIDSIVVQLANFDGKTF